MLIISVRWLTINALISHTPADLWSIYSAPCFICLKKLLVPDIKRCTTSQSDHNSFFFLKKNLKNSKKPGSDICIWACDVHASIFLRLRRKSRELSYAILCKNSWTIYRGASGRAKSYNRKTTKYHKSSSSGRFWRGYAVWHDQLCGTSQPLPCRLSLQALWCSPIYESRVSEESYCSLPYGTLLRRKTPRLVYKRVCKSLKRHAQYVKVVYSLEKFAPYPLWIGWSVSRENNTASVDRVLWEKLEEIVAIELNVG